MAERTDHGESPGERARDHLAHIQAQIQKERGKTAVEVAAIEALADVSKEGIGLLKELIRTGVSNPIAGACASMIVADMLQRAKLISPNTEACVFGVALAVVGVSLGSSIATDITSIVDAIDPFDLFKSPPAAQNNLAPTAQVVVFGDEAGAKVARALSGQLVPEVKYLEGKGE